MPPSSGNYLLEAGIGVVIASFTAAVTFAVLEWVHNENNTKAANPKHNKKHQQHQQHQQQPQLQHQQGNNTDNNNLHDPMAIDPSPPLPWQGVSGGGDHGDEASSVVHNFRGHENEARTEREELEFLASMTFANGGLRSPSCPCCV